MRANEASLSDRFTDFAMGLVNWVCDTCELLFEIFFDFLSRTLELVIALLQLCFQVLCFLRDMYIEAMQTFLNVFRGIVNVISSIQCEDVEDFAAACMVVLLWVAAVKLCINVLEKRTKPFPNPLKYFQKFNRSAPPPELPSNSMGKVPVRKKVRIQTRKKIGRRRPARSSASSSSCRSCD